MKIIINSDNRQRDSWIDLIQTEKEDKGFEFTNGSTSWFEKCKVSTYLVRTQSNSNSSPVFYYHINQSLAEKLQLLSIDLAVEIMDNIIHDGENTDLNQILSLQEASELWGLEDSTLRKAIANGRFEEGEFRKTGRNYIIKKSAMERVYCNKKPQE